MNSNVSLQAKYRVVKLNGKLTRGKYKGQDRFIFTASPFSNCPILEMTDVSRWRLIETVFECIGEY